MNDCCCPKCGTEQEVKLGNPGSASVKCPECGKPLFAKNDEFALTVKAYHTPKKGKITDTT